MAEGAPLGIGIVGCGVIARTHIRALLQFPREARVVALASRSIESVAGAAEYLRAGAEERATEATGDSELAALYREHARRPPTAHADYLDLVADPAVDAVIVTTPPFLHHPIALAALDAGRHVLCEKPLAISLREADELIGAARRAGRHLAVVSQGRFADEQRRMRALVERGALGRIFFCKADAQWYRPPSYYELWWRGTWEREGGGAATGQAIHAVDQALWILGTRPTRVYGRIGTFVHPIPRERAEGRVPIEDTALAIVSFEDGAMAEISAAVTHHLERTQIELYGERGAAYAYPWTLFSVDDATNRELQRFVAADVPPLPEAWRPKRPEVDPYQRPGQTALPVWSMIPQIGDFLDAVRTGREPLTGGAEGRRALELLTGLYKSAITGHPVDLPLAPDDPYYDGVAAGIEGVHPGAG
jgi:UDP-N-acetyl-2-amino-2-deoxyglucuronate dehydrogenase